MAKHITYTCAKKNSPAFRDDCKRCEEYNPCAEDGKWCFVGALIMERDNMMENAAMPIMESVAEPVLRDTSTVTINLGGGITVDVLREDMKKQLERDFYKGLFLPLA